MSVRVKRWNLFTLTRHTRNLIHTPWHLPKKSRQTRPYQSHLQLINRSFVTFLLILWNSITMEYESMGKFSVTRQRNDQLLIKICWMMMWRTRGRTLILEVLLEWQKPTLIMVIGSCSSSLCLGRCNGYNRGWEHGEFGIITGKCSCSLGEMTPQTSWKIPKNPYPSENKVSIPWLTSHRAKRLMNFLFLCNYFVILLTIFYGPLVCCA